MKICIVGGGTAGWLAALILSTQKPNHEYHVIESSKIPIIGVGEGSTVLIQNLLKQHNINELDFIKKTDGTLKYAIRFKNWKGDGSSFDSALGGAYDSFSSPIDYFLYTCVLKDRNIEQSSKSTTYSSKNLTDFVFENGELKSYSGMFKEYALHFNAYKVGQYFKNICTSVKTTDSEVSNIEVENGEIKSILLSNGKKIEADIFIDASGFSRLFSKVLNQDIKSYIDYLPLDRCLLFTVKNDDFEPLPVTTATAMNNGWVFEIPTKERIGRGYIYCSKFATDESAILELNEYYGKQIEQVRTIEFEPYRLENSAFSNVLAVGLASCFFEPLQATSIHNTIAQLTLYAETVLGETKEETINEHRLYSYNKKVNHIYDHTSDFIALHYLGGREDTEFWRFIKTVKQSETVKMLVGLAKDRLPRQSDVPYNFGMAGLGLLTFSMAGVGLFSKDAIRKQFKYNNIDADDVNTQLNFINKNLEEFIQSNNFLSQKEFLQKLHNDV